MRRWLLNQLFEHKEHQAVPRFAFQGTINWMAANAILVDGPSSKFSDAELEKKYRKVKRRTPNHKADVWAFEYLLMALHNYASIESINTHIPDQYVTVRSCIVAWYYCVYESASAMIAACSGSKQEEHSKTAKVWHCDIVSQGLVVAPFDLHLDTLVKKDVNAEMKRIRDGNNHDLQIKPQNEFESLGCTYRYLSGTAGYEKERYEKRIKTTRAFKELEVTDFKKKAARELRDAELAKGIVNYLVQAFRFRGKANYRDSIFLSYGDNRIDDVKEFTSDLSIVSWGFLKMACFYVRRRVEKQTWNMFIADLEKELRFQVDLNNLGLKALQ